MARSAPPPPSSFAALVLALLLGLAGLVFVGGRPGAGASVPEDGSARSPLAPTASPVAAETTLDPSQCSGAGYLCSGLGEREDARIVRWSDDTSLIRIGLPLPDGVPPTLARQLQAAAAAGILTWQDKPFRIELDRTPDGSEDFEVRWATHLEGAQLGRADTRWFRTADGRTGMKVNDFVLVHRSPFDRDRPLELRKVQLIAAHEMGHALGLPHSDSDRDVMFPINTAPSLSARDYATMAALYSLENGALVPPAQSSRTRP